jgi:hypothetical protein
MVPVKSPTAPPMIWSVRQIVNRICIQVFVYRLLSRTCCKASRW